MNPRRKASTAPTIYLIAEDKTGECVFEQLVRIKRIAAQCNGETL